MTTEALIDVSGATSARAPGPSRLELAGLAARLRDPFALLDACVERYGDVYSLPLGVGGTTVVNDPELVGDWLTDYSRYHKGEMSRALVPALGESIPVADGDHWQRNRKLLNPAFGRKRLNSIATLLAASIDESLERWDELATTGEEVDLYRELSILTMAGLQQSMFSSSVPSHDVPELVDRFRTMTTYMGGLMTMFWAPSWLPTPGGRNGRVAVEQIRGRIESAIADRRRHPEIGGDLLEMLLEARFDDGTEMTHENLVDQLVGLWFGGFDTTASALAWTMAMLATNPAADAELHREAVSYDGGYDSFGDLAAMGWARACFDEAQRLQGALLLTRQALQDDVIGGHHVPAGSQVGVSAYTIGRHPTWWDDPDRYDPARWLDERKERQHRFQFVLFGGGPRHCIGSGLAYLEAQFALTKIARRFRIETPPGWRPRHDFHLSVGIKGGLPARIHRREASAAHAGLSTTDPERTWAGV